jgi:threonine synthase
MSKEIRYYSTNLKASEVSFREALMKGLAADGGLYMPVSIPRLGRKEADSFISIGYSEIAFKILRHFIGDEIDDTVLMQLCSDAYNFDTPLEKVFGRNYILRLDQGPTASFKDYAARMMARLMNYFSSTEGEKTTILTATSGDTGGAVASAFHGLQNMNVVILFPSGEVTEVQRRQMTTIGGNVEALSVNGKFDDCQLLVKKAFTDPDLTSRRLTSANSINIGRLIPQSIYYFYAWSKLASDSSEKIIFSVPCGNFGNLMGGVIAREMGLPVKKFVISSNSNNEVPEFLNTSVYKPVSPSINCISSAMNVGHPSNLARIVAFYGGFMDENGTILLEPNLDKMKDDFYGVSVSDNETLDTMSRFYRRFGLVLEPHGAVAWKGLESYLEAAKTNNQLTITLETAHPGKFISELSKVPGLKSEIPESLGSLLNKKEDFIKIENNYDQLKDYILKHN